MPEGDTLRRLADLLATRFNGQKVISTLFRHPRYVNSDFTGATLDNVDARGKNLLMRFSNGYTIHVHLRMSGSVHPWFAKQIPSWKRSFEIQFSDGWVTAVDIPVLGIMRTQNESRAIGHLGPDICGYYNHELAIQQLSEAGDLSISAAMLDQQIMAGFGNIYAVETPFIVGINPKCPVNKIVNVEAMLSIGVALIRTNARRGPQNTTGQKLRFSDHWVLNRSIKKCKVCGAELIKVSGKMTQWGRRTSWCNHCQSPENSVVDLARASKLLKRHPCSNLVNLSTGTLLEPLTQPVVVAGHAEEAHPNRLGPPRRLGRRM